MLYTGYHSRIDWVEIVFVSRDDANYSLGTSTQKNNNSVVETAAMGDRRDLARIFYLLSKTFFIRAPAASE